MRCSCGWRSKTVQKFKLIARHLLAQHGETSIYVVEAELKMDASQNVKE